MFGKIKTKIYSVTFNQYTNCMKDTVSVKNDDGTYDYLDVGDSPLLIREEEIEKYRHWGEGIKDLHYVGELVEDEK